MEKVKIYLSGSMSGISFEEQSKWRDSFKNAILYGDYDCEKKPIFFNPVNYYNFEKKRYKSEKEIMEFDLNALRNSDLVVVNHNNPSSIGTAMELMLAYELRIPIIGINKDKKVLHPWLTECCSRMCDDIREAVDYTVEFFLN